MDDGERRDLLTDAYLVGVDLRERLRNGESLSEALAAPPQYFDIAKYNLSIAVRDSVAL